MYACVLQLYRLCYYVLSYLIVSLITIFVCACKPKCAFQCVLCVDMCTPVLEISGSAAVEPRQDGAGFVFYCPWLRCLLSPFMCVCDAARKRTVFNGNSPPSRIFSSSCVGGCCADVRDRQIEEREKRREGEK